MKFINLKVLFILINLIFSLHVKSGIIVAGTGFVTGAINKDCRHCQMITGIGGVTALGGLALMVGGGIVGLFATQSENLSPFWWGVVNTGKVLIILDESAHVEHSIESIIEEKYSHLISFEGAQDLSHLLVNQIKLIDLKQNQSYEIKLDKNAVQNILSKEDLNESESTQIYKELVF